MHPYIHTYIHAYICRKLHYALLRIASMTYSFELSEIWAVLPLLFTTRPTKRFKF